jgi:hypothetical protein
MDCGLHCRCLPEIFSANIWQGDWDWIIGRFDWVQTGQVAYAGAGRACLDNAAMAVCLREDAITLSNTVFIDSAASVLPWHSPHNISSSSFPPHPRLEDDGKAKIVTIYYFTDSRLSPTHRHHFSNVDGGALMPTAIITPPISLIESLFCTCDCTFWANAQGFWEQKRCSMVSDDWV